MLTISVCYCCGANLDEQDWERMPFHAIANVGDVCDWREVRLHACGAFLSARVSEVAFARPAPWTTATHLAMADLHDKLEVRRLTNLEVSAWARGVK